MSVNHPFAGPSAGCTDARRPPLLEVWHWSWLDPSWTTPLSWWQAWDPAAIPVGGSDWHRHGSDAPPGTPTTWVECDETRASQAMLEGLRAGPGGDHRLARRPGTAAARRRAAWRSGRTGCCSPAPTAPYRRVAGDLARLPGAPGYHRLLTPAGATVALTPAA